MSQACLQLCLCRSQVPLLLAVKCLCCFLQLGGVQTSDYQAVYESNNVRREVVLLEDPDDKSVTCVSALLAVLVLRTEPLTHSICASTTVEVVGLYAAWMSALAHASNFVIQVSPAIGVSQKFVTVSTAVIHLEDGKLSRFAYTRQIHDRLIAKLSFPDTASQSYAMCKWPAGLRKRSRESSFHRILRVFEAWINPKLADSGGRKGFALN